VPVIKKQESALSGRRYRYIPKDCVGNNGLMRKAVEDGDIIAITCRKKGLDIAHLGYAVWRNDGLHLLNASMIHHKVVEEPMTLYRYLQKHPSHTGIRIVRINKCN
uniref:N-acetylmuramoyl-L-alanine amidase-like domain-containing protein n=1 Tax=Xylanibacter rodentium TaxID=2736289 RepID=UPI002583616B